MHKNKGCELFAELNYPIIHPWLWSLILWH